MKQRAYAGRQLLAPAYLGISLGLVVFSLKFFQELAHMLPTLFEITGEDVVLTLLSLIDMVLLGSLLIMVMISVHENSISQLELHEDTGKLSWPRKLDSGSLKMKVAASIVAISFIHPLRLFMNAQNIPNDKIQWYSLSLSSVVSAAAMTIIEKFTEHGPVDPKH